MQPRIDHAVVAERDVEGEQEPQRVADARSGERRPEPNQGNERDEKTHEELSFLLALSPRLRTKQNVLTVGEKVVARNSAVEANF